MKYLFLGLLLTVGSVLKASVNDTVFYEYWDINSLTNIGGHNVEMFGEPIVDDTEKGKAVYFDGINDALFVDKNPFGDAKEFTFEVYFKPNGGQPNIASEPRFVCFWDPDNSNGPRMTIEIRVTTSNKWYFDGFLKTDTEQLTLIDSTKTHPVNEWMHAAVTYKDSILTTYVNGLQELSDTVGYTTNVFNATGKTSIGARYNLTRWYNGTVKAIKVTHKALTPAEFFSIPDTIISDTIITDTTITNVPKIESDASSFEIYPVPATDNLYIKSNTKNDLPIAVSIINSVGQVVYQTKLRFDSSDTSQALDVSRLQYGIYIVELQFQHHRIARKIFVIHKD